MPLGHSTSSLVRESLLALRVPLLIVRPPPLEGAGHPAGQVGPCHPGGGGFNAGTSGPRVLVGHGCCEDWNRELGRRLEGCQ